MNKHFHFTIEIFNGDKKRDIAFLGRLTDIACTFTRLEVKECTLFYSTNSGSSGQASF